MSHEGIRIVSGEEAQATRTIAYPRTPSLR